MTPAGVVFSRSFGGFSNSRRAIIASASKWVTATVLLRMVEHGDLSFRNDNGPFFGPNDPAVRIEKRESTDEARDAKRNFKDMERP